MNKVSQQLDIEELIALAKGIDVPEAKGLSPAETYILALNIQEGPDKVLPTEVWYRYKQWCTETGNEEDYRRKFFDVFDSFFRRWRDHYRTFYYLKAEPFILNEKYQRKLKRWRESIHKTSEKIKRRNRNRKKRKSITETNSPTQD